jgi:hypothetical protein
MLEIKKHSKLKVKIFDTEYEVNKPTIRQVEKFQIELKDSEKSGSIKPMVDYFSELGLPSSVVYEIDLDGLQALAEYLNGSKKN